MNQQLPHRSPQDILADIASGKIRMRPKWVFFFEHLAMILAMILVAIGIIYLGSFIAYAWRASHFPVVREFGPEGYGLFLRAFPWWQGLAILIGIVAFVYVTRRSTQIYRWPLSVMVGVFALVFLSAALITDVTRIHDRLANRTFQHQGVPFVGQLYPPHGRELVTSAVIIKIDHSKWQVIVNGEKVTIHLQRSTILPYGWEPALGDRIVVLGQRDDDDINAVRIMPLADLPQTLPIQVFPGDETYVVPPAYY